MIDATRIYYLVFGALTIAGGIIGFVKAKSRASLIAGGLCGLLLIVAGALMFDHKLMAGLILGVLVSVALAGQFVPKVMLNRAPIHSIVMAVLSVVSLILTIGAFTRIK